MIRNGLRPDRASVTGSPENKLYILSRIRQKQPVSRIIVHHHNRWRIKKKNVTDSKTFDHV